MEAETYRQLEELTDKLATNIADRLAKLLTAQLADRIAERVVRNRPAVVDVTAEGERRQRGDQAAAAQAPGSSSSIALAA